ncbi:hypothetical protein GPJ81_20790 [Pseudomonas alkylphenolica]|uniref:Ig-like domain repeat protein n=1 Tax=Pseudomonas alkylphenolica TaxID=237609 RepID=A0A6I6GWW7_9PSED|nr:hypothetical protein [Pseudomonas alkylphenolica]QGW79023.1 hypothetical protein GPJ81_20790 [Pseudomonas alkylphenolica]
MSDKDQLKSGVASSSPQGAELPVPSVTYAEDGVLDPEKVPAAGTKLVVQSYARIAVDDILHFSWRGKDGASLEDSITITSANLGLDRFELTISKKLVTDNRDAVVVASYRVERAAGGVSYSDPLMLRIGEVEAEVAPVIEEVTGISGVPIPDQGSTLDDRIILSGQASPNQQLQLIKNGAEWTTVAVDGDGRWFKSLEVPVGPYAMKAKALYGEQPESATWRITVDGTVPVIRTVKDLSGNYLYLSTLETTITLEGLAAPNQQVQLLKGGDDCGTVKADGDGRWSKTLEVSVGIYAMKAKALYGKQLMSRTVTIEVVAEGTPTISEIRDASNQPIYDQRATFSTEITLYGKARPNQTVRLLRNGGEATNVTTNSDGRWSTSLKGLPVGMHVMKAKASYGEKLESLTWTFEVLAEGRPMIHHISENTGADLPDKGTTYYTQVSLQGRGAPDTQLHIYNFRVKVASVQTDQHGVWNLHMSSLSVGMQEIEVRTTGSNPLKSPIWTFVVLRTS